MSVNEFHEFPRSPRNTAGTTQRPRSEDGVPVVVYRGRNMWVPPAACCGSNRSSGVAASALTADVDAFLTPGYVPLAAGSHHSPGAKCCRYFVAGRSPCEIELTENSCTQWLNAKKRT